MNIGHSLAAMTKVTDELDVCTNIAYKKEALPNFENKKNKQTNKQTKTKKKQTRKKQKQKAVS